MSKSLKLEGVWSSPGGDKKEFNNDTLVIAWWKNKKLLQFEGMNDDLKCKLSAIGCQRLNCLPFEIGQSMITNLSSPLDCSINQPFLHVNTASCQCHHFSTEIEGLKLDMAISEAKFEKEFANRTGLSNGFRDDLICLQSEIADIRNQLSQLH